MTASLQNRGFISLAKCKALGEKNTMHLSLYLSPSLSPSSLPRSRYLSRHATLLPTGEERCVTRQITAAWETTRLVLRAWTNKPLLCRSVTVSTNTFSTNAHCCKYINKERQRSVISIINPLYENTISFT